MHCLAININPKSKQTIWQLFRSLLPLVGRRPSGLCNASGRRARRMSQHACHKIYIRMARQARGSGIPMNYSRKIPGQLGECSQRQENVKLNHSKSLVAVCYDRSAIRRANCQSQTALPAPVLKIVFHEPSFVLSRPRRGSGQPAICCKAPSPNSASMPARFNDANPVLLHGLGKLSPVLQAAKRFC